MKKNLTYILLLSCLSFTSFSKKNETDSLRNILKNAPNDSNKVWLLHQLYIASDSVYYAVQGIELAKKINYQKGAAYSLLDAGRYFYFDGKQDISLNYLIKSVKIAEKFKFKKILTSAYRYIGFIYRGTDSYMAEEYYNKSLKICEETGDVMAASYALSAIGNVYEGGFKNSSENNTKALNYYLKSLAIREKKGSSSEITASLNETSRIYELLGRYDKAAELRVRGLEIAEKEGDAENIVFLNHVLGTDYIKRLHDYKKGLPFQLKAFEIGKTQKNNYNVLYSITKGIAEAYFQLGDFKKSTDYYRKSHTFNDSNSVIEARYNHNLSEIKHDLVAELEKQKLLLKDSEILNAKAEAEKQTALRNAFFIGFALVLILIVFVYKESRQKQKAFKELDIKNKEISTAYKTLAISENNFKQITETINDVFYLYNILEKKYEYISPNCLTFFGLDAKFFYDGKSSLINIYEEDIKLVEDATAKIHAGIPYDLEYRIIVNDKIKWIIEKSSPIFDNEGNLIRNSGICRDISVRKENEEKIRLKNTDLEIAYQSLAISENNFKQITETIDDVFYLYNIKEKKYEYISQNCHTLLGLDQEYFYSGKNMKLIVFEDDLQRVKDANFKVDSGQGYDIEYRIIVDGKIKWVEEKSSPIFDENGVLVRNSGICSDISQRKADEVLLRKKNKDITDSILYARTIQDAILVPKDEMAKKLSDFFIFYKPKDIVSGDFYFYKETKKGIIVAAADCTGHGVPAGFMSMIGNTYLNEIVSNNESLSSAQILDQLSEKIIKSLNQKRSDSESKDGMDISILYFDKEKSSVEFAGAQNPLFIVRNEVLLEYNPDMFPIGISEIDKITPFTNTKIDLQKGDALYIFSDGFHDQFGGKQGRKFMKKQLREVFLSMKDKKMSEQENILETTFTNWKGNLDQVDDVLVIGIKV